jgi:hypothetical protein
MNNQLIVVLSLLIFSLIVACGETINSTWKSQNIIIDGNADDWEGLPLQYQEDMNVVYGVVNDDKNIEFMIRFNNERLARMFSMRGFALWLNEEGEEEKQIGIYYRDDSMRSQFMADMRNRFRENQDDEKKQIGSVKPAGKFHLAKNDTLTSIQLKDVPGFDAADGEKNGIFCFEFSIPLSSESGSPFYLNKNNSQTIMVGLEILGMSEEEQEKLKADMEERRSAMQGGSRGNPGMGGMQGGMRGGRRGGGMRGGGSRPQMPDLDGEEYWISFVLAKI